MARGNIIISQKNCDKNSNLNFSRVSGFTLLELIIVTAMVCVAVGIAIPKIKEVKNESNRVKAESDLRAILTAVESYYISKREENGTWINIYPQTSESICATYLLSTSALVSRTTGPILIPEILYDPFYGKGTEKEYRYITSQNMQYYVIFSVGPDQKYDIANINNSGVLGVSGNKSHDDIYITNGIRQW